MAERKQMKQYSDKVFPLIEADKLIRDEWKRCRLKAKALWIKRKVLRPAFRNAEIWEDFKSKWKQILEDHGKQKLPPQRCLFTEPDLFDELDDLMDRKMDEIGMSGYKTEDALRIDIGVSGDKVVHESEDQ
ncbi:MAG: hypothetical protein ACLFT7_08675 [Thermoplasmata archaeon]